MRSLVGYVRLVALVAISLSLLRTSHEVSKNEGAGKAPLSIRRDTLYNMVEALARIHFEVCCPYCRGPEVKILDSTPARDKYKCDDCMQQWLQSYQVVQHTVAFNNN